MADDLRRCPQAPTGLCRLVVPTTTPTILSLHRGPPPEPASEPHLSPRTRLGYYSLLELTPLVIYPPLPLYSEHRGCHKLQLGQTSQGYHQNSNNATTWPLISFSISCVCSGLRHRNYWSELFCSSFINPLTSSCCSCLLIPTRPQVFCSLCLRVSCRMLYVSIVLYLHGLCSSDAQRNFSPICQFISFSNA